jgi:hypothetical protein
LHSNILVVHPSDADLPLPVSGDFTVEYSHQATRGQYFLLTEQCIQNGIQQVLAMR